MTNFILIEQASAIAILAASETSGECTLEAAAFLTGVHPDLLRHYCAAGLLGEQRRLPEGSPTFDDEALYEVRQIEYYRRHLSVNLRALPLVLKLLHEIDSLHSELRVLRNA